MTVPSRSKVTAASWQYLNEAAVEWQALADRWEQAFADADEAVKRPAGTEWTGVAAATAQGRAARAVITVHRPADSYREAATIALRGKDNQEAAQQLVLDAIRVAENDQFSVGEDYSVTDTITEYTSPAEATERAAAAHGHADYIGHLLTHLVRGETWLARAIDAKLAPAQGFSFGDGDADGGAGAVPGMEQSLPVRKAPQSGGTPGKRSPFEVTGADLTTTASGAAAGAAHSTLNDAVQNAIKNGPSAGPGTVSPGLRNWVKNPNVLGREVLGLSRFNRAVGAAAAVPSVIADVKVDGNSIPEALTREGAGIAAGLWAGAQTGAALGSIFPGAGTAAGLVIGGMVGWGASKGVAVVWQPAANAVGNILDGAKSVFSFG